MGLDDVQLPPIVIQQLFRRSLVVPETGEKQQVKQASRGFSILGNNWKQILIIVESKQALHLPDEELNFLLDILSACSLTMDDVGILNIKKNESVTYKSLTNELKPEKIFLFGVDPGRIELPLEFPHYQVQQYNNQTYLAAPPLASFQDNKADKTKLWNSLKQIFGI